MIDRTMQSFLKEGDPALPLDPARLGALRGRILEALEQTPQDPRSLPQPKRKTALRLPVPWPVRGFALGVLLCAAGIGAGRMVPVDAFVAEAPPLKSAAAWSESAAPLTLAMASPWDEWIGE